MDSTITRRRAFLAGAVVSIGGLALGGIATSRVLDGGSDTRTTDTFSETHDVAEISVAADVGSVSVIGTDRETVELAVEQRGTESSLDRTTLSIDEGNNPLDVTVEYDQTALEWLGLTTDSRPDTEIVLTVPHALEGDVTFESTNGEITYTLGDTTDATVTVTTSNGDIALTTDRADPVRQTDTELEAAVGNGTHQLRFETTNGDVTITG